MTSKYIQIYEITVFKALDSWHLKTDPWETGNNKASILAAPAGCPQGISRVNGIPGGACSPWVLENTSGIFQWLLFPFPARATSMDCHHENLVEFLFLEVELTKVWVPLYKTAIQDCNPRRFLTLKSIYIQSLAICQNQQLIVPTSV